MRTIALPNKDLRLLSLQLQNYNQGFTVDQIKLLDKVVRNMEMVLKDFMDKFNKLAGIIVSNVNEDERTKEEFDKQQKINKYLNEEGNETATVSLEDNEFEFVKAVWAKIGTFSGIGEAREAILKIDEAINKSVEPIFTGKKVVN